MLQPEAHPASQSPSHTVTARYKKPLPNINIGHRPGLSPLSRPTSRQRGLSPKTRTGCTGRHLHRAPVNCARQQALKRFSWARRRRHGHRATTVQTILRM